MPPLYYVALGRPTGPVPRLADDEARWRRMLADGSTGGRVRVAASPDEVRPDGWGSLVIFRAKPA